MTPYPSKVTVVSGKPLCVPQPLTKGGVVDEGLVTEYLEAYKLRLTELYDEHKQALGFGARKLVIL